MLIYYNTTTNFANDVQVKTNFANDVQVEDIKFFVNIKNHIMILTVKKIV